MPNLSFAQNRQNYVGIPLDEADNTLNVLQEKYIQNKDATDKLEIMLNNLELLPGDQAYKDTVGQQVSAILDDVTKNGDWENATLHVANAAKAVAGNPGLNQAIKSKQNREAKVAALKEKVGKPFEEGGITAEDFQREVQKADAAYTGVRNENGIWKGHWDAYTPPAYLDRGEYIDKFLDGWEANKLMGTLAKGEDGKWYRTKYTTLPDGSHHITEYTEEASDKDIYAAARQQLMQNANIRERIAYETRNAEGAYEDYEARGINRNSMIKELSDLGMSKNELNAMNNEELTNAFKTEMTVYSSIKGAVDKHSFKRETVQVLGKTWEQIQREMRLSNAKKSGGDEETVMQDRVISQFLTQGYSIANIPKSIDDYQKNIDVWDKEIIKHRKAIDGINAALAKNPEDKMLQAELASAQTKLQEYERNAEEYDYWYEKAVKTVVKGNGKIPESEVNDYFRNRTKLIALKNDNDINQVTKVLGSKTNATLSGTATFANAPKQPWHRLNELKGLVNAGKITEAQAEKYREYAGLKYSEDSIFGKMRGQGEDFTDAINKEMKKSADEKTVAYGYVDLSVDDFGKETAFTARSTALLRNNYNNYKVIDTDGQAVMFSNLDEGDKYIPENTTVLGVTTQYVGDHGYLLYAREDMFDKEGKKLDTPRFHLIKPTSMSGILDSAIMEARKGTKVQNNQLKPGFNLESPNELEQIWRYTDVDRQLSDFDKHPLIAPADQGSTELYERVTKPVDIGVRYDAKVTRLLNNAGDVKWEVEVYDKETKERGSRVYGSQYSAEFALEYLAGSGYAVPLSTLQRITDYSFSNGIIDKNQVSTPYMNPKFYDEMKKFDDAVGIPYTITSMTRSVEKNKDSNGIETSRHKYGFGVDLKVTDDLIDWLAQNSTTIPNSNYKKLMGSNLMYLIHDAGSGNHVHLEHTEVPDGVKTTSDISYLFKK